MPLKIRLRGDSRGQGVVERTWEMYREMAGEKVGETEELRAVAWRGYVLMYWKG